MSQRFSTLGVEAWLPRWSVGARDKGQSK